jgi:hypothetical protein
MHDVISGIKRLLAAKMESTGDMTFRKIFF